MEERQKLLTELDQQTAAMATEISSLIKAVENDGWNKAASRRLRLVIGELGGRKAELRKRLRAADQTPEK